MDKVIPSVIALDLSLKSTGWAVGSPDSRPTFGVFKTDAWADNEGRELHRFRNHLIALHERHAATHIVAEQIFIKPGSIQFLGTQCQFMLMAIALEFAASVGLRVFQVSSQQWRSRFLGTAKLPPTFKSGTDIARREWKRRALAECAKRGWWCSVDDEADALGLLDYALCALDRKYAGKSAPVFRRSEMQADRERLVKA